uniref:MD-2-related lipid-recognition domain-containing protein n=1 Tax=Stomoxys calcitrans TaxID=35570 RepID=A0A1I8PKD2_STOCA
MGRAIIWMWLINIFLYQEATTQVVGVWIKCVSYDPLFGVFQTCNASTSDLSIYIKWLKLPVTSLKGDVLLTYQSAFKPVSLINATWDICKLFKNPGRHYAFHRMYSNIRSFVNINHSCPYNHDLIISSLRAERTILPFPVFPGKYNVTVVINANGEKRVNVKAGITLFWKK